MANQVVTTSKRFTLNLNDWWKGLILAVAVPVAKVIIDAINSGVWTFNWGSLGRLALAAALAYLIKNFVSPPTIMITGSTPATLDAVKSGDAEVKVGDITVKPAQK